MKPSQNQLNAAKRFIKLLDDTKSLIPNSTPMISKVAKNIKSVKAPVPRFFEAPEQLASLNGTSEYDLVSVFKLLKYEPYFLKSAQKKQGLLVKSGFQISSDNDEIKKYMDARFAYMFLQTGKSLREIIHQVAYYLIVCSNAFLIKVRDKKFPHAESYRVDGKEVQPVVGLFLVHPTSMKPRFKTKPLPGGRYQLVIDKWIHFNARGETAEFSPNDVAHFTLFKEDGMIFGMPEVVPVIDDIRTLRKIEEDVQLLIYRDLFPIIHYTVDQPTMIDHQSQMTELDQARFDMEKIIQDGGIATDARHEINFVGNEHKGIDAKPYLEYFQQRVFTGLGVSMADMGMGQDISGATASSMSKQLTDAVRYIQKELAQQFNEKILVEMALQSPFGIDAMKEDGVPTLEFNETDIEWKIRQENHEADLFTKNVKTIDEVRYKLGEQPLTEEQLSRTYQGLIGQLETDQQTESGEHMAKVSADAAPKTVKSANGATKQVAGSKPAGSWNNPTSTGLNSGKQDSVKATKSNSNITKSPRNQDSIELRDSISLQDYFKQSVEAIMEINNKGEKKLNLIFATKATYDTIKSNMSRSFYEGAQQAYIDINGKLEDSYKAGLDITDNMFSKVDRLRDNIVTKLNRDPSYINIAAARVGAANKTEQTRAYNYGYALASLQSGRDEFVIYSEHTDVAEDSVEFLGDTIKVTSKSAFANIPPFRTNSRLKIKLAEKPELEDSDNSEEITAPIVVKDEFTKEDILKLVADRAGLEMQMLDALKTSMLDRGSKEDTELDKRFEKLSAAITELKDKSLSNEQIANNIENNITKNMVDIEDTLLERLEENENRETNRERSKTDTLKIIADTMRETSERNMEMFQAAISALPKSIEVNSAPMEVKLQLPATPEAPKPVEGKKSMRVIRDDKGQIISAEITTEIGETQTLSLERDSEGNVLGVKKEENN